MMRVTCRIMPPRGAGELEPLLMESACQARAYSTAVVPIIVALSDVPRLRRAIPVHHLHPVPGLVQASAHFLRDHDGAVAPAGAAKGNGQVALAFVNVVRQQIDQQFGDAL